MPIPIPQKISDETFTVNGCFCSFNCALAYNLKENKHNMVECNSLLYLLYKKMNGKYDELYPSPDKKILKIYGGSKTIDEYKSSLKQLRHSFNIVYPPIKSILPQIEEININNSYVNSIKDDIPLKLKRKNKYRKSNILDICIQNE